MKKIIICCSKIEVVIKENTVLCILDNIPFSPQKLKREKVFLQSDGGHGGLEEIAYCPFCGTKIENEAV